MPEIAFLLYEDMTALDAVGPYEVLARLPDADVKFVASTPGPKTTDVGLCDVALDPPFNSGSMENADAQTRRRATEHMVPEGTEIEVTR